MLHGWGGTDPLLNCPLRRDQIDICLGAECKSDLSQMQGYQAPLGMALADPPASAAGGNGR